MNLDERTWTALAIVDAWERSVDRQLVTSLVLIAAVVLLCWAVYYTARGLASR